MKNVSKKIILIGLLFCSLASAVPIGGLFTMTTTPVAVGSSEHSPALKSGSASSFSLFNVLGLGDSGINAAARQAGLQEIAYIDKQNIVILLGLINIETTIVYGR